VRVALYARVSTSEQTTENQVRRLKSYVAAQGWDDYEIIEEQESTKKTRPKKTDLLRRLRAREFDTVVIWKLDRWARSLSELVLELTELHNSGIVFVSVSDGIDLSSATGRLQFQILGAFAEFERELNSERTKAGLERAKAKGKRLGRPKGSKDIKKRKRRA